MRCDNEDIITELEPNENNQRDFNQSFAQKFLNMDDEGPQLEPTSTNNNTGLGSQFAFMDMDKTCATKGNILLFSKAI